MPLFLRRRSYDATEVNILLLLSYCGNQKTGFLGHFTQFWAKEGPFLLSTPFLWILDILCGYDYITRTASSFVNM